MESDLQRIKDLGFNVIRMGEFSWSMYEKEEGQFDFSFLLKAVNIAQDLGLSVILGTPTAAPPKWLIDRYPEVLCTNADGIVMSHGSRQHHNHTSEIYLKYCARITEEMVKSFCNFPNVIGWQIDNELHCHRNESYSPSDDVAFQKWLTDKYETIEALNAAWGTRFWSLEFQNFSQVECPRRTVTHKNPGLMTDYYLFLSDSAIHYAAIQAEIIRRYMPHAWITHNGYFQNIDYKKLTDTCLDFLSYDCYPSFLEKQGVAKGRLAQYRLAQTRGCSSKFLIMEQQSGPGGQLSYFNPTPIPGQIRLWTYQSILHGAVGIVYFRYRTALYGAEQLWYGIYDHDGEENYRSREIRQITQEIQRLGHIFLQEERKNPVAIYNDYHNICAQNAEPFFADDSRLIFNTLNGKNIGTDIIYTLDDLEKYRVVIIPHIAIADETFKAKLQDFADHGGIVILSAKSGTKDCHAQYRPTRNPGIFRNLSGCYVDWFTALPEQTKQYVQMSGKRYPVDIYYESLCVENGTAHATYTEDFCAGKPAIVKNGNIYYLGFFCRECADIYYDIIRTHINVSEPINETLEEATLGPYKMYLNHGNRTIALSGYDLLQNRHFDDIEPYGVVLIDPTKQL
jgi:beta-galactosidase